MNIKPEDVTLHIEGMPGKDDREGLVKKLVAGGRVEVYNWEGAFKKARENLTIRAAELGVRNVYSFKQSGDMPSDNAYEVTVEALYDPNTIEEN